MSLREHTLPKEERLSGRTRITALMRSGRYVNASCLRCCFLPRKEEGPGRIVVSVPKRLFKRAVKRNLLKRRIRESYRIQKQMLPCGVDLMFVYTSHEVQPFTEIYVAVENLLSQIAAKTAQDHGEV